MLQSFGIIVKKRTKIEIIEKKKINHFKTEDIETLLGLNEYTKTIKEWRARSNFKLTYKNFSTRGNVR